MKRFLQPLIIFQILFFGASTFLLHVLLFDFWQYEGDVFWAVLENWYPLMIIDLIGGLVLGFLISGAMIVFTADNKRITKALVLTDILWMLLCVGWYFMFGDPNAAEAAPFQVISPLLLGGIGLCFGLVNLFYFAIVKTRSLK